MRILVTGGTGFIGTHTVRALAEDDCELHVASREGSDDIPGDVIHHTVDMLSQDDREQLIRDTQPTHLLHLAWDVTPGSYANAANNLSWTAATIDLYHRFMAAGGKRFVGAGTCFELAPSTEPLPELAPTGPSTLYGTAKDACRRLLVDAGERHGVSTAWGRIFYVYGPGEPERRLVPAVTKGLLAGDDVACGPGHLIRDFVYVKDLADALRKLIHGDSKGVIHLGTGSPTTIKDIVTEIESIANTGGRVALGARSPAPEPERIQSDATLVQRLIGWKPYYDLHGGLQETVSWWKNGL